MITPTTTPIPTAPRLEDININHGLGFGREEGCDVIFLVGQDETWRIPAHQEVLQNTTPVFRAMFSDRFRVPDTVPVPDVDGRAFDNLLKYLYAKDVAFQSVETALRTLYAAHKYESSDLVRKCVDFIDQNLTVNNILVTLSHVAYLCGNIQNLENCYLEHEMLESSTDENLLTLTSILGMDPIEMECARLLKSCLSLVDKEALSVLQLDEMEDLDADTFRLILSRDTLDIQDENLVFNAILKWTDKECKRQQLPLTTDSKRKVLGELLFLPRYLTMTLSSFLSDLGPAQSGLFTPEEVDCLILFLQKRSKGLPSSLPPTPESSPLKGSSRMPMPSSLRPYYRMLARPRCPARSLPASSSNQLSSNSPSKKGRRGFNLVERWRHRNRRCCCLRRGSNTSSPSTPSSPHRLPLSGPDGSGKKWDLCVERVVIFLACLFD